MHILMYVTVSARSPVVGYLNASLEGLSTIRAFHAQKLLSQEFDKHLDLYTSTSFTNRCCARAFGLALDTSCTIFIGVIAFYFLIFENGKSFASFNFRRVQSKLNVTIIQIFPDTSVGNVGLAITQAFMLSGLIQYGIRKWAELENKMTSIERVLEYTTKENEPRDRGLRPVNWPSKGKIIFENVSLLYANAKEYVLKDVTFTIEGKEKIGIVGRTGRWMLTISIIIFVVVGMANSVLADSNSNVCWNKLTSDVCFVGAGKTSIISALFRLYQYEGKIIIDGIDTATIALDFLRSSIAIIPQDPVLFTGTARSNIDPLGCYQDNDIWSAVKKVKLDHLITSLDMKITESGLNFSSGQKQLLCLARAIVSRNNIVVLDEATASMDEETDVLIRAVLEGNFSSCTVITIAHKLRSVLKCHKVMLVEEGNVAEYGVPTTLLRNKNGGFYKMIEKAGLLASDT